MRFLRLYKQYFAFLNFYIISKLMTKNSIFVTNFAKQIFQKRSTIFHMKKLLIMLSIFAEVLISLAAPSIKQSNIFQSDSKAYELTTSYGYYKCDSSCLLFKTSDITDMSITNIHFIVPEGYFVKKIREISSTTLEVSYAGKTGFVMTERVREVDFLPENKYLQNITFDISSFSGTKLWKTPSTTESNNILVSHIPAGTKNISYIAEARGEIPAGATSSVWYFCNYSPIDDPTSVFEGYIHSEKTINLSTIPENIEGKIQETTDNIGAQTNTLELSKNVQIILISLISLPLLVIVVLLFLSSKRKDTQMSQNKSENEDIYKLDNSEISRKNTQAKNIDYLKNKKFSIKKSFENFMYENIDDAPTSKKRIIAFDTLDDEDDLL